MLVPVGFNHAKHGQIQQSKHVNMTFANCDGSVSIKIDHLGPKNIGHYLSGVANAQSTTWHVDTLGLKVCPRWHQNQLEKMSS